MKLKTSCFNLHIIKKNFGRFAPVWGLYTIFLLLVLFFQARSGRAGIFARNLSDSMNAMSWINLIYGCICAGVLFGDLYNSRICNALHAFPVRREGWVTAHVVSGMLFCVIPNFVIAIFASFMLLQYAYIVWIWLLLSVLQFLFFFGVGTLAAVCAGNRLAMTVFYAIIQFGASLVYSVVELVYLPLLNGVRFDFQTFLLYLPTAHMSKYDQKYVNFKYNPITLDGTFLGINSSIWIYTFVCAAIGLLSIFLGYLVYRNRKMEHAGDFISLKVLSPVFLVIYAFAVGAFFCLLGEIFADRSYIYFFAGFVVGFFTGMMLLSRTVNVFTRKNVVRCCILAGVVICTIILTYLDPIGITAKMPEYDEVKWAAIYTPDQAYEYSLDTGNSRFEITSEREFEELQRDHYELIKDSVQDDLVSSSEITFCYELKNGKRLLRYYKVDLESDLGKEIRRYLSDIRYVFQINDPEVLYKGLTEVSIECYDMDMGDQWKFNKEMGVIESIIVNREDQIEQLLDAIQKDCEAGTMAQYYPFRRDETYLFCLSFTYPAQWIKEGTTYEYNEYDFDYVKYYTINIYESCENTVEYLRNLNVYE